MEFDLEGEHANRSYAVLVSLVTPRPIAWVTSLSRDGHLNAAPFSFFNALGAHPPIIGFCPGKTLRIRGERFHVVGRMASPNWYCRTRDRFEMVPPRQVAN